MGLDVLTPKGQKSLEYARRAAEIWTKYSGGWTYARTPEESDCPFDAALIDPEGTIRAIVEQKSRDLSKEELAQFSHQWLVTMDKIVQASQCARMFRVPLIGFLYLIPEDTLLTRVIANDKGLFCVPFRCDQTITQQTINGGFALRGNAYIDMSEARVLTGRKSN